MKASIEFDQYLKASAFSKFLFFNCGKSQEKFAFEHREIHFDVTQITHKGLFLFAGNSSAECINAVGHY